VCILPHPRTVFLSSLLFVYFWALMLSSKLLANKYKLYTIVVPTFIPHPPILRHYYYHPQKELAKLKKQQSARVKETMAK